MFFFVLKRLHKEIEHYYEYMQLTPIEKALRNKTISRIETVVLQLWPTAQLKLISSSAAGLALPGGDIDVTVLGSSGQSPLQALNSRLLASEIADPSQIEVKHNLRVPLIRLIDRESRIEVDISFDGHKALEMPALIQQYKSQYPALSKLVLVLKQFLRSRDLSQTVNGKANKRARFLRDLNRQRQ